MFLNVVDEKKIFPTLIKAKNGKTVKKENDHNSIITKFLCKVILILSSREKKIKHLFQGQTGHYKV